MSWKFVKSEEGFKKYREHWDSLNRMTHNHLLLDSHFLEPLVRFFDKNQTLMGVSDDTKYPGVVLVENSGIGFWRTFQPSQAPIGPIILGNSQDIDFQISKLIQYLPGFTLGFGATQQDPDFDFFKDCHSVGKIRKISYIQTAKISIKGTFQNYWESRGRDLRVNLRKRLRRLEKEGIKINLLVDRDPEKVEECIHQYGFLEETGWKGKTGTAVTPANLQGDFYKEMLKRFCQQNEGVVYRLQFDQKTVAEKICLRRDKMLVFLKMAYDERYRSYAPGYLLQYEILKRLFEEAEVEIAETYGRVNSGWTDKWTDEFRTLYHLNFYRYSWVQTARDLLKGPQRKIGDGEINGEKGRPTPLETVPSGEHGGREGVHLLHLLGVPKLSQFDKWEFIPAKLNFPKYAGQWKTLNESLEDHPLLDPRFVEPLVQHFSSPSTLLCISKNKDYPGMVLVEPGKTGFWGTFQPSQAPIGLILLGNKENVKSQVQGLISSLPRFALGLSVTQQDSAFTYFGEAYKENNDESLEFIDYIRTAKISLTGTFEDYWKARGKDLVGNLARRRKKIEVNGGGVEFCVIREAEKIDECVRLYSQLESSGWKGGRGTAVSFENAQGLFYRDMLKKFCLCGEGVVYQLMLNKTVIASDLCLERNGALIVLKISYDEQFKNLSPSFIMREEVLRKLFAEGNVQIVEFYGRAMEWHKKWTQDIRNMFHVNVYRNAWLRKGKNMVKQLFHDRQKSGSQ